jgi:hypothetical protein
MCGDQHHFAKPNSKVQQKSAGRTSIRFNLFACNTDAWMLCH